MVSLLSSDNRMLLLGMIAKKTVLKRVHLVGWIRVQLLALWTQWRLNKYCMYFLKYKPPSNKCLMPHLYAGYKFGCKFGCIASNNQHVSDRCHGTSWGCSTYCPCPNWLLVATSSLASRTSQILSIPQYWSLPLCCTGSDRYCGMDLGFQIHQLTFASINLWLQARYQHKN